MNNTEIKVIIHKLPGHCSDVTTQPKEPEEIASNLAIYAALKNQFLTPKNYFPNFFLNTFV